MVSVQVEVDIHDYLNGDGVTLVHGWTEFVLPDSLHSFFIETHAEMAGNPYVLGIALSIDDQLKGNGTLETCRPRLL
jgi:hypothetical protein